MPQIRAAGHALEYACIDARQAGAAACDLVFLHEGLGSIAQWRDFPQRVAQASGRRAFVYDRYGYGRSEILREARAGVRFMHREGLEVLPEVLKELHVGNPVLVGHSDGASIALIHAGAGNPVRGLVLMAPHVFVEEFNLASIRKAKEAFETTDLPQRLGRYHRDARKTFYLWNDAWLDPEFERWNIEEYLPGIHCPLLAMQGEDDAYGTMAQLEAIRRQVRGPCELLKLPECGHSPHRDRPEECLRAVVEFIDSIEKT